MNIYQIIAAIWEVEVSCLKIYNKQEGSFAISGGATLNGVEVFCYDFDTSSAWILNREGNKEDASSLVFDEFAQGTMM